jgi:hypothetical protein
MILGPEQNQPMRVATCATLISPQPSPRVAHRAPNSRFVMGGRAVLETLFGAADNLAELVFGFFELIKSIGAVSAFFFCSESASSRAKRSARDDALGGHWLKGCCEQKRPNSKGQSSHSKIVHWLDQRPRVYALAMQN